MKEIKPNEHLVLKRGIGEAMNCAFKIEMSKEKDIVDTIFKLMQKNKFNGAYWLLQPWISQLQFGEMKMYFINGKFLQGYLMINPTIQLNSITEMQEIRNDGELWKKLDIPSVIQLGERVHKELVKKAPSLSVMFRLDIFRDEKENLVINELEYFGNMWLSLQHTTLAEEKLNKMADALHEYLKNYERE